MAIGFDETHRNKIGKALTQRLGQALADQLITLDDLPKISKAILGEIDQISTHAELVYFLEKLNKTWPIFENIATLEAGEEKESQEKQTINEVTKLIHDKKLDEAIKTAQSTVIAK